VCVREDVLYERERATKPLFERLGERERKRCRRACGCLASRMAHWLNDVVDSRGPGPAPPSGSAWIGLVPGCVWLGVHPKGRLQPSLFQRRKSIICLCPARPHRNEIVPLFTHISHTTNMHAPHLHPLCCACSCISIFHQATPRGVPLSFLPYFPPSPPLSTGGQDTQSSPTHTTITHPGAVV